MDNQGLLNKCIQCSNLGLLEFMFPTFEVKDELFFDYDNDIIYTGKWQNDIESSLQRGTRNFIFPCNTGYNLNDRYNQIAVLYGKWNKTPSETALDILSTMSDYEFLNYFKKYWVTGTSKLDEKPKSSIFDLYKVLGKSRHQVFTTYYTLREYYGDSYIFNCVLSFLEKVVDKENVSSSSGYYIKLLQEFSTAYGSSLKLILYKLYTMQNVSKEYKLQWLLTALSRGNL